MYIHIYKYINPGPLNPIQHELLIKMAWWNPLFLAVLFCTAEVELMDLLGEEGIQNLPLLERLQHLDPGDEARL